MKLCIITVYDRKTGKQYPPRVSKASEDILGDVASMMYVRNSLMKKYYLNNLDEVDDIYHISSFFIDLEGL